MFNADYREDRGAVMDEPLQNYSADASQTKTIPIRWLMLEAQRIRRERRMRKIEAAVAVVVIVVWLVVLANWVWLTIR